jgi:hypothetical protein
MRNKKSRKLEEAIFDNERGFIEGAALWATPCKLDALSEFMQLQATVRLSCRCRPFERLIPNKRASYFTVNISIFMSNFASY